MKVKSTCICKFKIIHLEGIFNVDSSGRSCIQIHFHSNKLEIFLESLYQHYSLEIISLFEIILSKYSSNASVTSSERIGEPTIHKKNEDMDCIALKNQMV